MDYKAVDDLVELVNLLIEGTIFVSRTTEESLSIVKASDERFFKDGQSIPIADSF
ncbi:hypothetical protein [Salipaludibacillus neizhouensis]|uniref:hypothetical protein n=1 Tax=Salipaludibacillus neizhouensis TaxID=885475 RepID=UPI0015FEE946|nr:hypothetical protein [Salipaludibacillus neizhouensis]